MPDPVKVEIAAMFPGEALFIKFLDVYEKSRSNMSEDNRNGWDRLGLVMGEAWNNWWVDHGWPGRKV